MPRDDKMTGWRSVVRCALVAATLLVVAPSARAQNIGRLDVTNRALHDANRFIRRQTTAVVESLPSVGSVPEDLRNGAGNLASTWLVAPLHATALAIAGHGDGASAVLSRMRTNIVDGRFGLEDAATARGMPQAPRADIGLALCARGVPEGPYVVFPVLGGRTLRDGLADLVIANAAIYGSLIPFFGTAPPIEVFVAVEILDNIPIWLLAERMGRAEMDGDTRDDFTRERETYLADRRAACAALRRER